MLYRKRQEKNFSLKWPKSAFLKGFYYQNKTSETGSTHRRRQLF